MPTPLTLSSRRLTKKDRKKKLISRLENIIQRSYGPDFSKKASKKDKKIVKSTCKIEKNVVRLRSLGAIKKRRFKKMTNREFLEKLNNDNLASIMLSLITASIAKYHKYGQNPYETDRIIREKRSKGLEKERQ